MFKMSSAYIHYGSSTYELDGLPEELKTISGPEDVDPMVLTREVGRLTGFPREFEIKHCPGQTYEFPDGPTIEIPEQVAALANGYSIFWRAE